MKATFEHFRATNLAGLAESSGANAYVSALVDDMLRRFDSGALARATHEQPAV